MQTSVCFFGTEELRDWVGKNLCQHYILLHGSLPHFSILPMLLSLSLVDSSAFFKEFSPTYTSCLAIGHSAFYYTNQNSDSVQIFHNSLECYISDTL